MEGNYYSEKLYAYNEKKANIATDDTKNNENENYQFYCFTLR